VARLALLFALGVCACGAGGDILWDNGGPDGRDGLLSVYCPEEQLDEELVDDLVVSGGFWGISGGHFSLVTRYGEGPQVVRAVKVFFYADDGNGKPLVDRYAERDCQFCAYLTGDYYFGRPEVAVDVQFEPVVLPGPGRWWVCFQPDMNDWSYWLTAQSKEKSSWVSWPYFGYPKWTYLYYILGDHYDVSFRLTGGGMSGLPNAVIDLPESDVAIGVGDHVEFAGTATDEEGYIVDWLWTFGEGSGVEDMHVEDPGLVQFNNVGIFTVTFNAQDNDLYWDWSPDTRTITVVDPCTPTQAPDPEPYCEGALFARPAGGYPGWVWFSIPLDPADCCGQGNCYDPEVLLGFTCSGRLWYWDRYVKASQVYKPPFVRWDLAVGDAYLLYLEADVENPGYRGVIPDPGFPVRLGRQGWTWVGMPGLVELGYPGFMGAVQVARRLRITARHRATG
jgi:hypothetical protein